MNHKHLYKSSITPSNKSGTNLINSKVQSVSSNASPRHNQKTFLGFKQSTVQPHQGSLRSGSNNSSKMWVSPQNRESVQNSVININYQTIINTQPKEEAKVSAHVTKTPQAKVSITLPVT